MKLARETQGWDQDQVDRFINQQFHAQDIHYREYFPNTQFSLIVEGEEPVGRLYVDRRTDEIRVIDIALLAEHRGKGIGGMLMRQILDEGAAQNLPVRIHVEQNNVAMHLYDRLGFKKVSEYGVYALMEWLP